MTTVNRRRPSGLYDTREDAKEESGVMNKSRVEAEPDRLHALPHLTLREVQLERSRLACVIGRGLPRAPGIGRVTARTAEVVEEGCLDVDSVF